MGNFFSTTRLSLTEQAEHSALIKKVVALRVGTSVVFEEDDFAKATHLIDILGEKILKARYIYQNNPSAFKHNRQKLHELLAHIQQCNPDEVYLYLAELLQFYSILCHQHYEPLMSFVNFSRLLTENEALFGETKENPFIVIHQLGLIYNDLIPMADSLEETKLLSEADLALISGGLVLKKNTIEKWLSLRPKNIFMRYLSFCWHYTSAKLLEVQAILALQKNPELKESSWEQIQIDHLQMAYIEIINIEHSMERNVAFHNKLNGLEYSFGLDVGEYYSALNMSQIKDSIAQILLNFK
jgi:hypothetical protein